MRDNLHALLGVEGFSDEKVSFDRLYEIDSVMTIIGQFERLLNRNPSEEVLFDFIKDNPLFLHIFSPKRVFYKAPILSKYKTDITILNQNGELLFIELEKADTPLLTKNGEINAKFQHAISQIHDWLYDFENHKAAVLDCLGVDMKEVSKARGVAILGRDSNHKSEHLRKLKWKTFDKVSFLTYDDLLRNLVSLRPLLRVL